MASGQQIRPEADGVGRALVTLAPYRPRGRLPEIALLLGLSLAVQMVRCLPTVGRSRPTPVVALLLRNFGAGPLLGEGVFELLKLLVGDGHDG
ncbi:hypothetical protein ACFQ2Y_17875 [Streptomyces malaysiensis subsp. malaysiensis]